MHFDPWTFGLQAANFLVLVWLLQRFLYRPVLKVIGERQAAAAKLTADLAARAKAADDLRQDLEAQRAALLAQRESVLAEARDAAAAERKALLAQAQNDAAKARSAAQGAFERERADVAASLGRDAARVAVSIVRRLLKEPAAAAAQSEMLRLVCDDVARLPDDARARIRERLEQASQAVEVATAAPLDAKAQAGLAEQLGVALGAPTQPTFKVEPALLVGVEVRFPFTILRRAWSEDLTRIEAELIHDDGATQLG